jgi:hypothetical protein
MGWLTWLKLLLEYGPSIVALVTEIVELIQTLMEHQREDGSPAMAMEGLEARLLADFENRGAIYKRTRDRGPLREMRDTLRARCGFECKPTGAGSR